MTMRGFERAADRDAVKDALAGDGMARPAEQFAQRAGVLGRERRVLLQREGDDRLDILASAARIGDELAADRRNLPRGHVLISGRDDIVVLRFGERAFRQYLIVPEEVRVQRRAAMRRDGGSDSIVILGITLRLLERLLAA